MSKMNAKQQNLFFGISVFSLLSLMVGFCLGRLNIDINKTASIAITIIIVFAVYAITINVLLTKKESLLKIALMFFPASAWLMLTSSHSFLLHEPTIEEIATILIFFGLFSSALLLLHFNKKDEKRSQEQ